MTEQRRSEFINMLANDPFVKKHLYERVWISGSSTEVYPIQEWNDSVDIQWKTDRPCPKWIDKIVKQNNDLIKYGYFLKSDRSCPSCVSFHYVETVTDYLRKHPEERR